MKIAQIKDNKLEFINSTITTPNDHELLIKTAAIGINRADLLQVAGLYRPSDSKIPGLEISGEVVDIGKKVTKFKIGDKACSLISSGGYAEFSIAHEDLSFSVPSGMNMIEASCLPEALFTSYLNLKILAGLQNGETLLINGGASGLGSISIQLAKILGARVITSASTEKKCLFCQELGADIVINYKEQDFVTTVKSLTDNLGVDVIMDIFGGEYFQKNISCLKLNGRLLIIGFMKGSFSAANLSSVLLKNLTIFGRTLSSQNLATKIKIAAHLTQEIWPLVANKKIIPIIDRTFPFEQVNQAHEYMKLNEHLGKIALTL